MTWICLIYVVTIMLGPEISRGWMIFESFEIMVVAAPETIVAIVRSFKFCSTRLIFSVHNA
jgi:hypothetical protein